LTDNSDLITENVLSPFSVIGLCLSLCVGTAMAGAGENEHKHNKEGSQKFWID